MDTENQIVVPIFYEIDPSHVRKLKRRIYSSRKYEDDGKLIEEVVRDVFNKLIHTSSGKHNGLVAMDSHIAEINSLSCPGADEVRLVGIWGMGGLGKTTIARAVYDNIACEFEHCCFLENVKEGFTKKGKTQMQEELLSRILMEKVPSVGILDRGSNTIMEKLGTRKVLLVLDDVDDASHIEILLGQEHSFGIGSRILITTRDIHLLRRVDKIYRPKLLNDVEALQLFGLYAFKTNNPSKEYDNLSRCAVKYAQGLPLALKVLGAYLFDRSIPEWNEALDKIRNIPHMGIHGVLKTSFDGLDDSEKDIFLDIACFFRGRDKDYVAKILDACSFYPQSGLRVLNERALITISHENTLEMHDLLQEMGREVVPTRIYQRSRQTQQVVGS